MKFIDNLVSRANSSIGALNKGPSSVKRIPITPRMEASVAMERSIGVVTPYVSPVEGTLEGRDHSVGLGGPEEVYRINEEEVTKEVWLQF